MRIAATVVVLLAAAGAFAQTPPTGLDPLDKSKTSAYYLRARDEIRAMEAMEASRRALRTAKFRDVLHDPETKAETLPLVLDRFITAGGVIFEAVQVGLPAPRVRPGTKVTFFGEIKDRDGKVITDFEEPVRVLESKGDLFVERSIFLPVAKANAAFGIANGNDVVGIARVVIDDEELTPASSTLSRLIVSNNIYNLDVIQGPFDPFAFGGTRVVPKPNRAFHRSDEMWLFAEIRNPATADDGKPRLVIQVAIEEGGKTVATTKMAADASPLKGVAGHFGLGTTVDLTALRPGNYAVRMIVTDQIAHRSFERSETIFVTD